MTEAQHQQYIFKWAAQPSIREKYPCLALLHHIPNGGTRDVREGAQFKRQGVKSGVPDLHLPIAVGKWHSLYIELKVENGTPSDNQAWWITKLNDNGNYAVICYGWKSAVDVIQRYLEGGINDFTRN